MNFNSRNTKFKKPFGAVKTGEQVTVNFPFGSWVSINKVFFVLRKNRKSVYYPMKWIAFEDNCNIYECSFNVDVEGIYWYRFEMHNDDGIWYYGRDEFCNSVCGHNLPEWQLTVYKNTYKTPDFAKGGVIYHIFADRFNRGKGEKTVRQYRMHKNWNEEPVVIDSNGEYRADDFFGGNIKGIIEKLDYLENLGVTVIYLSPIFEAYSNHRYDTGDYLKIDELFGTEKDFKELIVKAKARGISVILDGVFNHSGEDSIYFNKYGRYDSLGAYQSKQSPYYNWYYFKKFPDKYDCWWGNANVPTLNKSDKGYRELLFGENGVIEKWTKAGVAGWRLDVVDELPIDFTDLLCKSIKKADKETLIIGEVWEDASTKISYTQMRPYLLGNQLDGVMNYPFKNAIIDYIFNNDIVKFKNRIMTIVENYPKESLSVSMNVIGTHDTVRILNTLSGIHLKNHTKVFKSKYYLDKYYREKAMSRLKCAATIQFTLPGIPSIYYGDEAGLEGFEDPINRRPFPWNNIDEKIHTFYCKLGKIRKENRELFYSDFEFIENGKILAYRWYNGVDEILVLVNNTNNPAEFDFQYDYTDLLYNGKIKKGCAVISAFTSGIYKRK